MEHLSYSIKASLMVTGPNKPDGRGSVNLNDLIAAFVVKVYLPVVYSFPPIKPFLNFTVLTLAGLLHAGQTTTPSVPHVDHHYVRMCRHGTGT